MPLLLSLYHRVYGCESTGGTPQCGSAQKPQIFMLIPTSLFPLRLAMIHPHSLQFRRECDNHNNPLSVFSSSESHFVPPESFVPLALWSEASYLGGNEGINGSNQISESNIFPPHQSSNVNSSSFQFHQNLQGLSNPSKYFSLKTARLFIRELKRVSQTLHPRSRLI